MRPTALLCAALLPILGLANEASARPTRGRRPSTELVSEKKAPKGEKIRFATSSPDCVSEEDGAPEGSAALQRVVRTRGRTLDLRLERAEGHRMGVGVYERGRRLWWRDIDAAGGASAASFCSHDGWGVVVAGHYRHGDDVYDLFTGKKRGPGDGVLYAPDLSYGLVVPRNGWATECPKISRSFRIPTDGKKRPYALDTIPVPDCDAESSAEQDPPSAAISPDGKLYAIVSSRELALFRASDDEKVATVPKPYARDAAADWSLDFSASGRYLVVTRDWSYGDGGERLTPSVAHWYRIDRAVPPRAAEASKAAPRHRKATAPKARR